MFLTHKKINTEKTITNKLTLKHKHVCANTHTHTHTHRDSLSFLHIVDSSRDVSCLWNVLLKDCHVLNPIHPINRQNLWCSKTEWLCQWTVYPSVVIITSCEAVVTSGCICVLQINNTPLLGASAGTVAVIIPTGKWIHATFMLCDLHLLILWALSCRGVLNMHPFLHLYSIVSLIITWYAYKLWNNMYCYH